MIVVDPLKELTINWLKLTPLADSHHSITVFRKEPVQECFDINSIYNIEIKSTDSLYVTLNQLWNTRKELEVTAISNRGEEMTGRLMPAGKVERRDHKIIITMTKKMKEK